MGCVVASAADDPVVAQARALLVAKHPSGHRVATARVPTTGPRRQRIEALLSVLADPSTRLLPAKACPAFLAEVSGKATVGVGLRELLDLDLGRDGRLVVLSCPRCGGTRRVVAVVLRSTTAQGILEHLRLHPSLLPEAMPTRLAEGDGKPGAIHAP